MKKILIVLLAASMLLCGCGKAAEEEVITTPEPEAPTLATAAPTPEPTVEPTPEPTPEPIYSPLTGEEIDEEYNTRPYAVMLNNISVALPQCSIGSADIVYEILAEGGITRFMAIFSDMNKVDTLGSMRSLRPYYLSTALSYDAIMVHAGGSDQAYSDLSTKNVDNIDGVRGSFTAEVFYRDSNRMAYGYEHSLFTSGERILTAMEEKGYRTELTEGYDFGLRFSHEEAPSEWSDVSSFTINYGTKTSAFTYSADTGKYTMVQYNQQFIDGNTNEAVAFSNVIVISAATTQVDDYGRLSVTLTGTGTGTLYREGKSVDITWSRSAEGEPFLYTLADGSDAELSVGTTFISVIPTGTGSVTVNG
jgi:hypothetical protein